MITRLLTAATLAALPLTVPVGTTAATVPAAATAAAVTVLAGPHGSFAVTAPTTVQAGRVTFSFIVGHGSSKGGSFAVVSYSGSYGFADAVATQQYGNDHTTSAGTPTPAALRKLRKLVAHTTFHGGAGLSGAGTAETSMMLSPGSYTVYDDNGALPSHPAVLDVVGPPAADVAPATDAHVVLADMHFGGDRTLPRSGTLALTNTSDDPHFLALARVAGGTTHAEVARGFATGDLSFLRAEAFESEVLSPGQSDTLSYSGVARGAYLEVCFFPDLRTGVPHAFLGMYRLVRVK